MPAPIVSSFNPTTGIIGSSVTIAGSNFTGATGVKFGGVSVVTFSVDSDTQITAVVPAGALSGKVSVTNGSGTGTSTTDYTIQPNITSFSPATGVSGNTVTITGTGFTGVSAVAFNGVSALFTFVNDTSITATVPDNVMSGAITVTTPGGTATSSTNFNVVPAINSIAPTSGAPRATVTITGTNFSQATAVKFNGIDSVFTVVSDQQISAMVPTGATTGTITVQTPGGTATSATFTVLNPPAIQTFTPNTGDSGTVVTIIGTGFTGATSVKFMGSEASSFTVVSDTSITATVPAGAIVGQIVITTPAGSNPTVGSFIANITGQQLMPLSRAQAAYRAWVIAAGGLDEETSGLLITDVEEMIDQAVKQLCDQIMASKDYYRLQTSFSVGLSGGQGNLPDAVMGETILSSKGGRVLHNTMKYPLSYLPNFQDLKYPQPGGSELGFYHIEGGNSSTGIIYASDGNGNALTGTLTIIACAYQTYATLAPQLADEFIALLADMAKAKRLAPTVSQMQQ